MSFEASEEQLAVLWDAVNADPKAEQASDGHLRWAFLVDFTCSSVSERFHSGGGAIVHAEDGQGPIAAWFYASNEELNAAWENVFCAVTANVGDRGAADA